MLYYTNKKSNKKHYIRVIFLILLIIISSFTPYTTRITSRIANIISAPFVELSSIVTNSVNSLVDFTFGTKPNREMVNKLSLENQDLRQKINQLENIVSEKDYLKSEYELRNNYEGIPAKITMLNNDIYFKQFMINKGTVNNVKVGDIVVNSYSDNSDNVKAALVGIVIEVYPTSAKISSIMDDTYNLTFVHGNSNVLGVIDNRIGNKLNGYMLEKTEIKSGDAVYTSGVGNRYRRGIYIGKIEKDNITDDKLRQEITIESPINFSKLYNVFVIKGEN